MAIPESQLETWAGQGSVTQSSSTYATIRNALLNPNAVYVDKSFDVFLQGSYGNDTNIFAESDVDIVIRLDAIMRSGLTALPPEQVAAYCATFGPADYTFNEFKAGVVTRLTNAFGAANVNPGNKAIKIKETSSRRSADVVVCYQYRRYTRFISESDQDYVPGIVFPTTSSGDVINYPKAHSANLTAQHQATNEWLKPMIRIVKNMRSRMVDDGAISSDLAPSYFIEGLLYNVPSDKFGGSYGDSFCNCLNWLRAADRTKLLCANRQYYLLGSSNVQWPTTNCDQFLDALVKLWDDW